MRRLVDPFKMGLAHRPRLARDGKVLCVDFFGTLQEKDIHKELIKDVDTGRYVYRCKINIKDFDPDIRKEKGLLPFDFSDERAIIDTLNAEENFDIPLWFLRKAKDKLENIVLYDLPLIYQIMGCNFCGANRTSGCIQCFVDNKSNVPNWKTGVWLSPENVADTFEALKKSKGIRVIRTSGGEPTLVLDHILALYEELARRGPRLGNLIFHQFDTNLSTAKLINHFKEEGVFPYFILERIADYNPCVLVSIKGVTDKNLQRNTQSAMTIADQIEALKMFVRAGIDVYPSMYNPDVRYLRQYMEMMEGIFENFLLKTRVFPTKIYGPTKERITNLAHEIVISPQALLRVSVKGWAENYDRACEILNEMMMERYGLGYKLIERPGIKISLKE